jgi:hypothetical protein
MTDGISDWLIRGVSSLQAFKYLSSFVRHLSNPLSRLIKNLPKTMGQSSYCTQTILETWRVEKWKRYPERGPPEGIKGNEKKGTEHRKNG